MSGEEEIIEVTIDMAELKKMKVSSSKVCCVCGLCCVLAWCWQWDNVLGCMLVPSGCTVISTVKPLSVQDTEDSSRSRMLSC